LGIQGTYFVVKTLSAACEPQASEQVRFDESAFFAYFFWRPKKSMTPFVFPKHLIKKVFFLIRFFVTTKK